MFRVAPSPQEMYRPMNDSTALHRHAIFAEQWNPQWFHTDKEAAESEMGSLPVELLTPLHKHRTDVAAGLFWAGWGEFLDTDLVGAATVSTTR